MVLESEGLESGVYHHRPENHSFDLIRQSDFRRPLLAHTEGQHMVLGARMVLVIAAVFQRTRWE